MSEPVYRATKGGCIGLIYVLIGIGVVALALYVILAALPGAPAAVATPQTVRLAASPTAARVVTLDGQGEVATINLWDDYTARTRVVGRVSSGASAELLRIEGEGVLVRASAGTGWVSRSFIRELR